MKRVVLALLAALLTALVPAPADAATKKPAKAKVVCFKKTVETKSGRKVRKKVCRPRRKAATVTKRAPTATPSTPTTPDFGKGSGPSPNSEFGTGSDPVPNSAPAVTAACVPEDSEWLTVTALDVTARFVLRLSRTCLRAGRTVVQYLNQDAQEHDLWVEGASPQIAKREMVASAAPESLEQAEATLTAGQWRLFCSLPGHETMSRTVSVVN